MSRSGADSSTETGVDGTEETFTGRGLPRREDHRILTGEAEYIHDKTPENALHMALFRSVHPHAKINSIDTKGAEDHPKCHLILTGDDIAEDFEPMPCGLNEFEEWSLARDVVRFVGEPVVAVVAENRYVAEDIIDLI
ncbi:MAG: carbon monoxide dehydrogenase, partial [Halobacteriaceae archaeon]